MLIDIKRDVYEIIKLKPIDTGNKLHIKFSEDGKPVDLTGQTVKFMAKKPDGTGVYNFATIKDAKAGEIEINITNQMTSVDGELECELELEGSELITTMTFYIIIDRKLNDGNFIESTNEFTVLQKAIRDTYEAIETMEHKTDTKLEQLQSQVNSAISDMNDTTDTKLTQVQSQVNTAISDMNNITNNKLSQLQTQVNTAISDMNNETDDKLIDLQQQVTTSISDMNSKTDNKLTDVQKQFDTLETELTDIVDNKIIEINGTQNTLTNNVNNKVTEVNNKLKVVDTKIAEINNTISNANTTVEELEQDVTAAIAGIDSKIDSKLSTKADKNHNHDNVYLGKTAKAESSKVADSVAWANVSGKPSSYTPASHNHDSSYLKLSGGSMTGKITTNVSTGSYLAGNQGNAIINTSTSAGAYVMLYRYPSTNGYFTMGGYQGNYLLQYTAKGTVDAGTNSVTKSLTLLNESGNTSFPGTVSAPSFSGALSGNANTATTLQIARSINGTNFNGSGNITTANWGTARTITIGNTSKSVNGSGNVSWSISEIGASSSNHTHNYAGSSSAGGNANAAIKLATARSINGTNFDGTGNITTANWGTARTLTIGKTGKSVNGSGNVAWSLSEIGALPLSGGTLSGGLTVNSDTIISGMLNMNGSTGAIKLSSGGCRIYGLSSTERLHVEGGIYTNRDIQVATALITGANKNSNPNITNCEARIVRGFSDNIGSLKVQVGGTTTTASFEVVSPDWSSAWFSCGYSGIRSISYSNFSDKRLKTNVKKTPKISDKVNKIEVYTYNYLSDFDTKTKLSKNIPQKRWGVIAQEVEKLFPELIIEAETLIDGENKLVKSVDVYGLTVLTLAYAKDLEKENNALKLSLADVSKEKDNEILKLKLALAELVEGGI